MMPYDPRTTPNYGSHPMDGDAFGLAVENPVNTQTEDFQEYQSGSLGSGNDYHVTEADSNLPISERFLFNLRDSMLWSRRQIMPGIQKRLDVLRRIVGRHYGSGGSRERVPTPYLRMQTAILARHMVARAPRMMIETRDASMRGAAKKFEIWSESHFETMDLEHVLFRWAYEALIYPVGIMKICSGLAPGHDGQLDYGSPYVENVDPERAVWDMAAKSWKQLDFIGHRYVIDKALMMKPGSGYNRKLVKNLRPDPYLQMNELGVEKTETIAQDSPFNYTRLREYIEVWEVYLPKEGISVHLPVIGNQIDYRPIFWEPYVGLQNNCNTGPFPVLWYEEVPGSLMPSPPVHAIYDLDEAINLITRKLLRQTERQKINLLVQSSMSEDAKAIKAARDGDIIPVTHPEAFKETRMGGPDQQNLATMLSLKQLISWFGGNFDALGGLGPQSSTVGQDKLISASSSQLITFMQQEVYSRTTECMRGLLWYEWNSRRTQDVNLPVEGMEGMSIRSNLQPKDRGIEDFFRMTFAIHPASMQPVSPQSRVQQWMQLFQTVLLPAMGLMAQQGQKVDMVAFAKKIADYLGLVDIDDILKVSEVPMAPPGAAPGEATTAPAPRPPGTGEYTRTNVSTPQGQDQEILEAMKPNNSQAP